jgi:hypothetical protein
MCCNALREGEGGWPLGQADRPEGGSGSLLWSLLGSCLGPVPSHVFWSLLVLGSDPFDAIWSGFLGPTLIQNSYFSYLIPKNHNSLKFMEFC